MGIAMDSAPTYEFWWRFAAVLVFEVAALTLAVWALQKFSSSGAWRRTLWHICLIGLVALVVAETSGLGRIVVAQITAPARLSEATVQYSETFSFAVEPSSAVEGPITVSSLPDSTAAVSPQQSWWPAILWLAGFAVLSLWAVFLRVLFAIASRRQRRPACADVVQRAQHVASMLGLRRPVKVVEVSRISAPVAFGILWTKIGVPEGFDRKFTAQQQEVMLAHELAHVLGRDAVWHLLADFVTALLWWHPVAWWVRRRLHLATEAAADEASMVVKDGPIILAETLVVVGGLLQQDRGALGIKGLRSGLACRVQTLMAVKDGEWRGRSFRNRWLLKFGGPLLLAAGTIACFAWTGSSRGTPRDEWQNSLAGRTFATLSTAALSADLERIPGLLGDARIFFDAGKLDHAEGLCEEVLKIDPENAEALQLIDTIAKARKVNLAENVVDGSGAKPGEMERILPSQPRASKDRFIAPQTIGSFEHFISNVFALSSEEKMRKAGAMPREPSTRTTNVVSSRKGRQRIRRLLDEIRLPSVTCHNVRLAEVLSHLSAEIKERDPEQRGFDLIVSSVLPPVPVGPAPIDPATVLPTPIGHLPVATERLPVGPGESLLRLENRNIRIDPPLQNVTLGMALDAICKAAEPPVYYLVEESAVVFLPADRPVPLYTRMYKIDPDALLGHLHPLPRERDLIDTLRKFFTEAGIDLAPPKAIFFKDRLGMFMIRATLEDQDLIQKALSKFTLPARQALLEVKVAEFRGDAVGVRSALGIELNDNKIITDLQYRMLIRALEQRDRVALTGPQRAVTISGYQSRFQLPTVETLGLDESVMRVITRVAPDDRSISLDVFVGDREAVTAAALRDGQTLMLHLPALKKVYANGVTGRIFVRIAFLTVTIIDAAGNRLHAEEQETNPIEGISTF